MELSVEIKDLLGDIRDVRKLKSQIEDYEFEDARETFERIVGKLGLVPTCFHASTAPPTPANPPNKRSSGFSITCRDWAC